MTLKHFKQLDEMEQAEVLWEHEPIDFRSNETFKYLLYQIDSFYVETRYHKEHNLLTGLWAFDDTGELGPYLAQRDISEVMLLSKRYTVSELTQEALEVIPDRIIQQVKDHPQEKLIELHPTIGLLISTELGLWQRKVEDQQGKLVYPDDVSMDIISKIHTSKS